MEDLREQIKAIADPIVAEALANNPVVIAARAEALSPYFSATSQPYLDWALSRMRQNFSRVLWEAIYDGPLPEEGSGMEATDVYMQADAIMDKFVAYPR